MDGSVCNNCVPATANERDGSARIVSIDLLRGLVMAVMALDHTRDFFGASDFNSRDVTEPALFLTRWVTHLCAPTFILLAGLSAFLYGRGKTTSQLSSFLLIRGLWLILIEFTLIKFGWRFDFDLYHYTAGVIFVIGASMIVLAALIWFPRWTIACVAFALIGGHNLLDGVRAEELGAASSAWHLLHQPGPVPLGDDAAKFYVLYPLIPWIGVMAAGYLLGPVMQLEPDVRQRLCLSSALLSLLPLSFYAPPTSMAIQLLGRFKKRGFQSSYPS